MTELLRVKRLSYGAVIPSRADTAEPGSVGYDLHADLGGGKVDVIGGRGPVAIRTGIALALPPGTYGRIAPRSGLAAKHGIDVLAGVIDPSFRGELVVLLVKQGDGFFTVEHGMRIAQLVLERVATPDVAEVAELDATERGANGFGSTGT